MTCRIMIDDVAAARILNAAIVAFKCSRRIERSVRSR